MQLLTQTRITKWCLRHWRVVDGEEALQGDKIHLADDHEHFWTAGETPGTGETGRVTSSYGTGAKRSLPSSRHTQHASRPTGKLSPELHGITSDTVCPKKGFRFQERPGIRGILHKAISLANVVSHTICRGLWHSQTSSDPRCRAEAKTNPCWIRYLHPRF